MSALVVSLHDVSPLTRDVFTTMLRELAEAGVTKTSLLVIADHHHRGHMLADHSFCRWLEGLARAGHEVVIHGYYHQRPPRKGETLRERWMTGVYTMGEGEFYDLSEEAAAELLARAREDFGKVDIPEPRGFIAPAWLLSSGALRAVAKAKFVYTTSLAGVRRLAEGEAFERSQSLVYSCRNAWRRTSSLVWNATLRRRLRANRLLRLSLHPPDRQHSAIWQQILNFARADAATHSVTTYGDHTSFRPLPA